jgi:outer membrane biosynthesis protein TonB
MRKAVIYSAGLHLAVIVFTLVGLPALFTSRFEAEPAIAVEIVTVAEKAAAKPAPPPKPAAPQPPPPAPKVALPPEPPPEPPPVAEKVPPPPEVKPEPPKAEPPTPVAKPEPPPPPKPAPPQETAKAVPEPPRKPPPPDAFDTLLKDLARERDSRRPAPTPPQPPQQQTQVAARSAIDEQRLAASLAQMVMSQITPCWSIPAGAKDAAGARVAIRISLNPDGSLAGVPMVENAQRMNEDATFRTVAESALRALRHPRCAPLRLPYEHYNTWKLISLNFDPKDVLSQ